MEYLINHWHTMYGEGETFGGSLSQLILSHTRAFHACDNLKSGWRWSHRRSVALDDPCVKYRPTLALCVCIRSVDERSASRHADVAHLGCAAVVHSLRLVQPAAQDNLPTYAIHLSRTFLSFRVVTSSLLSSNLSSTTYNSVHLFS